MSFEDRVNEAFHQTGLDMKSLRDWRERLSHDTSDTTPAFNENGNVTADGLFLSTYQTYSASAVDTSAVQPNMSAYVDVIADKAHGDGSRMFRGVGMFGQARLRGGSVTSDSFLSTIAGYAVVDMVGDGDGIGVHGRARKSNRAGNLSDAAGVLGDVYVYSIENGGTMALEGRGYQNVAGMIAGDGYGANPAYWSTTAHLMSDSIGSPVFAAVLMGGTGKSTGKYSFWNGLSFTQDMFAHNGSGAGVQGTVGINMGAFTSVWHPEIAWKLGYADGDDSWHMYRGNAGIHAAANLFNVENPGTGAAGVRIHSKGSSNAYIDLQNDGSFKGSWFFDNAADDVKFGTAYDGDLVIRRNNTDRLRFGTQGAELTAGAGVPSGFNINSVSGFNSYLDFEENGTLRGHLFWDSSGDRMILGTPNLSPLDLRTNGTLSLRIDTDQNAEFYKALTIFDTLFTKYNSDNFSDVVGLISGTAGGTFIQGVDNSQLVLGLKDNSSTDSFAVVSGGGNYMSDEVYDTLVFQAYADGNVGIPNGNLTVGGEISGSSISTNGEGIEVSRGDGQDVSGNFGVRIANSIPNNNMVLESDGFYFASQDGLTNFLRITDQGYVNAYNTLSIRDTLIGEYTASNADIVGLVSGTSSGTLIQGRTNGHIVMALRNNGATDKFAIISGGSDYTADSTYDSLLFEVSSDGDVSIPMGGLSIPTGGLSVESTAVFEGSIFSDSDNGASKGVLRVRGFGETGENYGQLTALNFNQTSKQSDWRFDNTIHDMLFYNDGVTYFDESVGVGALSPESSLHVRHATRDFPVIVESGDAAAMIAFRDVGSTGYYEVGVGAFGDALRLRSGGSTRATLDASGNLDLDGAFTNLSLNTTGEGVEISRGDGQDVSSNYGVRVKNPTAGNGLVFQSDIFAFRSSDGSEHYGGFTDTGQLYVHDAHSEATGLRVENGASEKVDMFFIGAAANAEFVMNYGQNGNYDVLLRHDGRNTLNNRWGFGTDFPDTEIHVDGAITLVDQATDPANPDAGNMVMWVSDGTGAGSAGDVMMKINVGGTTKTVALVDYSSV